MKAEKKPASAKEPAPGDKKRPRAPAVKATPATELPAAPGRKAAKSAPVAKKSAAPAKNAAAPRKAPAKAAELVIETAPAAKKPVARKRKAPAPAPEVLPPQVEVLPPLDALAANDAAVIDDVPAGTATIAVAVEMVVVEDDSTRRHRIAVEAYLIAESRGFPQGCDDLHWLEAERKLYGKP